VAIAFSFLIRERECEIFFKSQGVLI
jgi:hypothetical protein